MRAIFIFVPAIVTFVMISINTSVGALETTNSETALIHCDKFDIRATRDDNNLLVSLDTDCPDYSEIILTVSRSYYEKGDDTEYAHYYFEESGTIENWRQPRKISIEHDRWTRILQDHRNKMNAIGLGYTVGRIVDNINVRVVLHLSQSDKRFGAKNNNLVGQAVNKDGPRFIRSEKAIQYPLGDNSVGSKHIPSTFAYSLEIGQIYILSKTTPLMPTISTDNVMESLSNMQYIPENYSIRIMESTNVNGFPWYRVTVLNDKNELNTSGWINSIALVGQSLQPVID